MQRKKISEQTKGRVTPPLNVNHADEIEAMAHKLIGARQMLNLSFALWLAWRSSGVQSSLDTPSQVIATLSECLEMVNHLTNTLDQLRMLTYGSKGLPLTTNQPELPVWEWRQLALWDDEQK